jgi:ribosomal protein S18 acetylase RimI-like enzyme
MTIVDKAREDETEQICRLDRAVLGDSSRRGFLHDAVKHGQCLVARVDEGIVGFAVLDRSFLGQDYISLLIVHPEHRRRGHGTALIRHIESICPTEKLFTSTNASNTPMQRLCHSLGFVRSGHIDNLNPDPNDPEIVFFKQVGGAT